MEADCSQRYIYDRLGPAAKTNPGILLRPGNTLWEWVIFRDGISVKFPLIVTRQGPMMRRTELNAVVRAPRILRYRSRLYSTKPTEEDGAKNSGEKDRFLEEIEAGVDQATKGRYLPENRRKDGAWLAVIDELPKPDRNTLFPLERDVARTQSRLLKKVANSAVNNSALSSNGSALGDVVEGFKLVCKLATGKAKFNWEKKPEVEHLEKDPVERALKISSWEAFDQQLETTITRLHNLKSGEELVILGAGVSGLSLAWFVAHARPDIKVRVLEKSSRVGGYMQSLSIDGTVFEAGPRTLLPSHPGTKIATQLIEQLDMADKLGGINKKESVNTKAVVYDGKIVKFPSSGSETFKFLNSPIMSGIKWGVLKDFLFSRPRKPEIRDETVESFVKRRFNRHVADRFVSAMIRGIYAGDISELSARSVTRLNKLYMLERTKRTSVVGAMFTGVLSAVDDYSKTALPLLSQALLGQTYSTYEKALNRQSMVCLNGGIEQLASTLATELESKFGDRVKIDLDTQVTALKPSENTCEVILQNSETTLTPNAVISTLPAKDVGPMLVASEEAPKIASEIKYATMAVVNMHFPSKQVTPNWFGFLVPKSEKDNGDILGVIFDSSVQNSAVPITECVLSEDKPQKEEDIMPFRPPQEETDKKPKEPLTFERVKQFFIDQLIDEPKGQKLSPLSQGQIPKSTTLTVMMGGHLWDGKSIPSEDEVLKAATKGIQKYLPDGQNISPSDFKSKVTIQRQCIPQPTVGHTDRVQRIHEIISTTYNNRLFLSGTSFGRGVGVGDCIVDSLLIASRFSEQRKLLYPQYYINQYMTATYPSLIA